MVTSGWRLGNDNRNGQDFLKENIIAYLTRPEVTLRPKIGNYKEVISEFKKQQCRVRENEKCRQKRAAEREHEK